MEEGSKTADRRIRIAIYMRLSKEDEWSRDESNSIRIQRILLQEYVAAHFEKYCLYEFMDDGYSGTNFNRPGVSELLDMVKGSLLDCIVVKDFSRFSRDYIELGAYIDQIFPFMRIRFISINDHYDSEACPEGAGRLDISFKNLLYDLYSKDLSVKVKSSLAARREKGQYVCGNCPFGYEKAPQDRHRLVIAEDEAVIVRRIFAMASEGKTSVGIARTLNREGIRTPADFLKEKGRKVREPKGGSYSWGAASICQILRNEAYTGAMVYGKYCKETAGGAEHLRPREEWKVFRGHHEPIVEREVFERVQRGRGKKRPPAYHEKHPLTGTLVCAACGRSLQVRRRIRPYFVCPNVYTEDRNGCIRRADALFLEQEVLMEVRRREANQRGGEEVNCLGHESLTNRLRELEKQERAALAAARTVKRIRTEAYERYAQASKKEPSRKREEAAIYRERRRRNTAEEEGLKSELTRLREEMRTLKEELHGAAAAAEQKDSSRGAVSVACRRSYNLKEETIRSQIDKVVVSEEKEAEDSGGENISIEILWKETASMP